MDFKHKVAIVGCGSFGTALAVYLAKEGHLVKLYTRRKNVADSILFLFKDTQISWAALSVSSLCFLRDARSCMTWVHSGLYTRLFCPR